LIAAISTKAKKLKLEEGKTLRKIRVQSIKINFVKKVLDFFCSNIHWSESSEKGL